MVTTRMAPGSESGDKDLAAGNTPQAIVSAEDGIVQLPAGIDLGGADYARLGPDLVIESTDGTTVVVTDYFATNPPADLMVGDSARLAGETAARLAGPLAPGQVAQVEVAQAATTSDVGQPIGQVELVDGTVTATRVDGTVVELAIGDPVFQGDIIESDDNSGVGIVLADDTTFAMAEGGRMVLDEMIYDPGEQEGSLAVSVLEGVFTFVSGQVAKTDADAMTIETPLATIGIRGTQGGIDLSDGQLDVVLMQESASANNFVGEITISNPAGVSVLNILHDGATVLGLDFAPGPPISLSLAQVLARFGGSFSYLPVTNNNANSYEVEPVQPDEAEDLDDFDTAAGGAPADDQGGGGFISVSGDDEPAVEEEPIPDFSTQN